MPTIHIDGQAVTVPPGATILDGARLLGIDIPAICQHVACEPNTSCLACVVRVNGSQRLVPSCATVAVEAMAVESETPDIHRSRRTAVELLLSDHAGDCMAPCERVCPGHIQIPIFLEHYRTGRKREAIETIVADVPLLGAIGWLCPGLCEKGCRRGQLDDAVSIGAIERQIAELAMAADDGAADPGRATEAQSGRRVAIIGSGPAALSAAWHLLEAGHAVSLFDRRPTAGGSLVDLASSSLPANVLAADVRRIRRRGAEIHTNAPIGPVELAGLRECFNAVLFAGGAPDASTAALGMQLSGGHIRVDPACRTNIENVFAAGASVAPQKHVIGAIAQGRQAADAIDFHLRARPFTHRPPFSVRSGALKDDERQEFLNRAASGVRRHDAALSCEDESAGSTQGGMTPHSMEDEAGRCVRCQCQSRTSCTLKHAAETLQADAAAYKLPRRSMKRIETHPAIHYEPGKCIGCGICVQIARQGGEAVGLTHIGRGFTMMIAMPMDATLADALQSTALACAEACPTGALHPREQDLVQITVSRR